MRPERTNILFSIMAVCYIHDLEIPVGRCKDGFDYSLANTLSLHGNVYFDVVQHIDFAICLRHHNGTNGPATFLDSISAIALRGSSCGCQRHAITIRQAAVVFTVESGKNVVFFEQRSKLIFFVADFHHSLVPLVLSGRPVITIFLPIQLAQLCQRARIIWQAVMILEPYRQH